MSENIQKLIEALPKAELHVHLEGTITPELAFSLACRHGHPLMDLGEESIQALYRHASFPDFLDHFKILISLLQDATDIFELVMHYARFARQSNIVYAEVHFTPLPLVSEVLPYPLMLEAVERGIHQARGEGIELRLILDSVRHRGPEHVRDTLRLHQQYPSPSVIGFGMGGDETAIGPEPFEEIYGEARQLGLHPVVHSGEAGDAASIRETLERLRPKRILHGIRAIEDAELVKRLAETQIPLDVCPSSNVGTGVVASLQEHPIRRLFDAGVRVTINTDDPPMFGTDLNREYALLAESHGFTPEELFWLAQEGFQASFLPPEQKAGYLQAQQRVWAAYQEGAL